MIAHRRFHYHALAHALSGELTRPVQHTIEVQAGTALPSTGGVGSSHVENFRVDEVVSFKRGYSHVSGSVKNEGGKVIHTTIATATLEGFNILDVVTADRIVMRLSSSFEEPQAGQKPVETQVLVVGSKFENLRIAGYLTDVELDHELFLNLRTFGAVRDSWKAKDVKLRQIASDTARALKRDDVKLPEQLEAHEHLFCSLVKEIHFQEPGFQKKVDRFTPAEVQRVGRHGIYVVDFGHVYLAEVLCRHGQKTLTMIRVELGSPNGGGLTGAEGSSNGEPPW